MIASSARAAKSVEPAISAGGADRAPSVRRVGVTLSGRLVVACEVRPASRTSQGGWHAVDVEFPEDARGLLAVASWGDRSVVDAVSAIAVDYLTAHVHAGPLARFHAGARETTRPPARVCLSTAYLRAALVAPRKPSS
jgi:hypothetical protein